MSDETTDKIANLVGEIRNAYVTHDAEGNEILAKETKGDLQHYLNWISDFQGQVIDPLFNPARSIAQVYEKAGDKDEANRVLAASGFLPIALETMVLKEAIKQLIEQLEAG